MKMGNVCKDLACLGSFDSDCIKGAERADKGLASLLSIIPKNHTYRRRVSNDQRKVYFALLFRMGQQITLRSYRLFCLAVRKSE